MPYPVTTYNYDDMTKIINKSMNKDNDDEAANDDIDIYNHDANNNNKCSG